MAAAAAIRTTTRRTPTRCSARSCAWIRPAMRSRPTRTATTRSPRAIRSSPPAARRRSGRTGCAIPFRNNFDPQTGNLLIGDVGQGAIEEIDLMRPSDAGANFGWPILEGTVVFRGGPTTGHDATGRAVLARHRIGQRQFGDRRHGVSRAGRVVAGRIHLRRLRPSQCLVAADVAAGARARRCRRTSSRCGMATSLRMPARSPTSSAIGADASGQVYLVDFDGEIFVIEAVVLTVPLAASAMTPQRILQERLSQRFGGARAGRRP